MRNVIGTLEKSKRKNQVQALILAALALGCTGCNSSREEICGEFPTVATEIAGVEAEIAQLNSRQPAKRAKPGRRIASVEAPSAAEIAESREAWMEWGEKALKRTQWAKDALENDKRGRKAVASLSDAGLSLVSFHGYVEQGKWKKATAELDRAQASLRKAHHVACDVEAPPRAPASVKAKASHPRSSPPSKKPKKRRK